MSKRPDCYELTVGKGDLSYGMNNYVLIWGDWLSCDPLRGWSHDSQTYLHFINLTL